MGFTASPRNNRDLHRNLLLNIRIANLLFLWVDLKPRQKPDSKQKLYIGIKVSEKGFGYFHTYECCTHSKKMAATLLCVYITSQLAELQIKWNSRRRNSDCCVRFLVSSSSKKSWHIAYYSAAHDEESFLHFHIYSSCICNRTYIHTAPELLLLVLLCIIRFCSSMPTLPYTSTGI